MLLLSLRFSTVLAVGPQITGVSYSVKNSTVRGGREFFELVEFLITFDQDLYLNGRLLNSYVSAAAVPGNVTALSNTLLCFTSEICSPLSDLSEALLGFVSVTCTNVPVNSSSSSISSNSGSGSSSSAAAPTAAPLNVPSRPGSVAPTGWLTRARIPTFFVPTYPVADAATALFYSLGLSNGTTKAADGGWPAAAAAAASRRQLSGVLFLQLGNTAGEPQPIGELPTSTALGTCTVSVNASGMWAGTNAALRPLLLRNATGGAGRGLTNAAGESLLPDSSAALGIVAKPRVLACDNDELQAGISMMLSTIESVANVSENVALQRAPWIVSGYWSSDGVYGCVTTMREMLVTDVERVWRETLVCGETPDSDRWLRDPCCNPQLAWTQCCRPRLISSARPYYADARPAPATCKSPKELSKYLSQIRTLLNAADNITTGCTASAQLNFNTTLYQAFAGYYTDCQDRLWTPNARLSSLNSAGLPIDFARFGAQAGCKQSSDCYPPGTECIQIATNITYCATPTYDGEMDAAMFRCLIDEMPARIRTYMQLEWQQNVSQPIAEFSEFFRNKMFVEACYGGTSAWFLNFNFSTGTPQFRPPKKEVCLGFTVCNPVGSTDATVYGRAVNSTTCPSNDPYTGATELCGNSYKKGAIVRSIAAMTWPSGCFLPPFSTNKCLRGTYLAGVQACYLGVSVTHDQCLPRDVCPKATWNDPRQTECLESFCYSKPTPRARCVTNASVAYDMVWRSNWANGTGLCVVSLETSALCNASGFTWNEGKFWYNNSYDTKEECPRGPCRMDPNTLFVSVNNEETCATKSVCTLPCWNCWSRNSRVEVWRICYTRQQTSLSCNSTGGEWQSKLSVCSYKDLAFDADACRNLGYTYESCLDLTREACHLCETGQPGCPVNNTISQCALPELGLTYSCRNKTDCIQNSGRCGLYNSLDFTNQYYTDAQCNFQVADGFQPAENCRGVCTTNYNVTLGRPTCPVDPALSTRYQLALDGCRDFKFGNRSECVKQPGHWWVTRPTGLNVTQECAAFGINTTCWNPLLSRSPVAARWTHKSPQECEACGYRITNTYEWDRGAYNTASYDSRGYYKFTKRGVIKPHSWNRTLEWNSFRLLLRNLAARRFSPFVQTELQCRYNPLLQAVSTVACTCGIGGPEECFSDKRRPITVGTQRFCPSIADSVQMASIQVTVSARTVPRSTGCIDLTIGLVRAAEFAKDINVLTSQDVSSLYPGGAYGVVTNSLGAIVGQLRSNGAALSWRGTLADPILLCLEPTIDDTGKFKLVDFALMDTTGEVPFRPLSAVVNMSDSFYCTPILVPGTYFVIMRREGDWEDVSAVDLYPLYARVIFGIEAALFGMLCLAALFAFALGVIDMFMVKERRRRRKLTVPQTMLILIACFALIRCIWLATVSSVAVTNITTWGQSILSEFPIYLMYSIFSTLIILWLEATSFALQNKTLIPGVVINVLLYLYYIILLIAFTYVDSSRQQGVAIAYRAGISAIALLTVALFWVVGLRMLRTISKHRDKKTEKTNLRLHISVVILILSGALVLQVAFLLAGAVAADSSQWPLNIVYYVVAELVPLAVLAHVLAGPVRRKFKRNSSKSRGTSHAPGKSLASNGGLSSGGDASRGVDNL